MEVVLIVVALLVAFDWYRGWPWMKVVGGMFSGGDKE
jgi:hypothetical protein